VVFPDFDPVIFQIGPVAIRWYALAYVAGILIGWAYVGRLARNEALWGPRAPVANREQIDDLVLWITIGVIVGGRVGSMLFYSTSDLWEKPLEIFKIWKGGMSFHGGLIGVMLAMIFYARSQKMPVLKIADLVAPSVPIGLFFGRIANFVNAELWGRPTDAPWGVTFCNDGIRERIGFCPADEVARHPSQLYEAALEGVVLFIILRLATHHFGQLKRPGAVTGLFLFGYGVFRTMVEFFREPDANLSNLPLGLTMGMLLSAPMWMAGLVLILRSRTATEAAPVVATPATKTAAKKPTARKSAK
jgi:phosphatidylglycerol---prolipoprotein diacylglyceryl transferase